MDYFAKGRSFLTTKPTSKPAKKFEKTPDTSEMMANAVGVKNIAAIFICASISDSLNPFSAIFSMLVLMIWSINSGAITDMNR